MLNTTAKEKDIDVTKQADMNVSEQCGISAINGNQLLEMIRGISHIKTRGQWYHYIRQSLDHTYNIVFRLGDLI